MFGFHERGDAAGAGLPEDFGGGYRESYAEFVKAWREKRTRSKEFSEGMERVRGNVNTKHIRDWTPFRFSVEEINAAFVLSLFAYACRISSTGYSQVRHAVYLQAQEGI
jgi:hypothetical protein